MGEQHIQIRQLFNAPVDTLFDILTDHESFGQVISAREKSIGGGIKRLAERYEN